jgi:type IV pilus assembly protein PilF
MNVRALLAGAVALGALGCASTPGDSGLTPAVATTGQESESRARARAHTELAAGYYELGNMSVALEEVTEALRADGSYGPAYNVAGLIYSELKQERLAQESFQQALRINPLDSDANNNYGRFLCDRKREDEAIRHFSAALKNPLYQTPERAYVNAGVCSRRRGDIASAQDYFERALKVRPGHTQALYHLADLAYGRGQYQQAKSYLTRMGRADGASAEYLWLALRVERRLGDRDAAASYGSQLTRRFPDSKEAKDLAAGRFE